MPYDHQASNSPVGSDRPPRRRTGGAPSQARRRPSGAPHQDGSAARESGTAYAQGFGDAGDRGGSHERSGSSGGRDSGSDGYGRGGSGDGGNGGSGGNGGDGGGDWSAGGGGRRRRGRRGGRGSANRRGRRPSGPGGYPKEESSGEAQSDRRDAPGTRDSRDTRDSFGEGVGPGPAPEERGGSRPREQGGENAPGFYAEPGAFPPSRGRRGGGGQQSARGPRGNRPQGRGPAGPQEQRSGGFFPKPGKKPRRRARGREDGPGGDAPAPQNYGELVAVTGVLEIEKGNQGFLRQAARNFHRLPEDTFVSPQVIHRYGLRDGSFIEGQQTPSPGLGKRPILRDVKLVDGMEPEEAADLLHFKRLVSVDPDFQYRLGDVPIETGMDIGDTSLRIMDMLMPLGRGQRALIVAPPRGGKTILMQKMAKAIEIKYPDVHLMVLLIDERPEEGTYWKRSVKGEVYVSTADESPRDHVDTAEGVWRRACRLCECGQEVVVLLDSITRLARAYNQVIGNSGRILSGGIDSRTMERPKKIFGSARNTEDGGSLTIIGTCLVDTGSKMDQVIFEEFKGTGNMEINLSRLLAEKRIFPSFDIAGSGTRKEELLLDRAELLKVSLLRRVLNKMRPMEAMELLIKKLEQYPTNREFLEQFNLVNYQ